MRFSLLLSGFVIVVSTALAALPPPESPEEAAASASLVVVGALGKVEIDEETGERSATLEVRKILYGKDPGGAIALQWRAPSGETDGRIPGGSWRSSFEGKSGATCICFLVPDGKGGWKESDDQGGGSCVPLEVQARVEKALQTRIERDLQPLLTGDDPESAAAAFGTLCEAGKAALPAISKLLDHEGASQRGWGCRLAEELQERSCAARLGELLDDARSEHGGKVSERALSALGAIAGKTFSSAGEAKAWLKTALQSPRKSSSRAKGKKDLKADAWHQAPESAFDWPAAREIPCWEVAASRRDYAEKLLEKQSCILLEDSRFVGVREVRPPAGTRLFLVRALYLHGETGDFDVHLLAGKLVVRHACLGRIDMPMRRSALIVLLPEAPKRVDVTCSMAE